MDLNAYTSVIHSATLDFGIKPHFVLNRARGLQGFASLYAVTAETAAAIVAAGTTAKFAGVVYGERLWIDIDSYEQADIVEARLVKMGLDYVAYDSGGKGAHFGVLRTTGPSHLLPLQDKAFVEANFPEADTSIYTHLHLFRLPGTVHQTTGRRKTLVTEKKGKALVLPPYERKRLALVGTSPSSGDESLFFNRRLQVSSVPAENGERHATLVKAAYALRDHGVDPYNALFWLSEVNKMFREPKDDDEVQGIAEKVYGETTKVAGGGAR